MAARLSESVGSGPGAEAEATADPDAKRDVLDHLWFVGRGGGAAWTVVLREAGGRASGADGVLRSVAARGRI